MPHPRVQESFQSRTPFDESAFSSVTFNTGRDSQVLSTIPHVQGDVESDISFKDQGRHYSECISIHPSQDDGNNMGTPIVKANPMKASVHPFPEERSGATGSGMGMVTEQTSNTSHTLHSSSHQQDHRGESQTSAHSNHQSYEASNDKNNDEDEEEAQGASTSREPPKQSWFQGNRLLLVVAIAVVLLGVVVGAVVAVLAGGGGSGSNEDDKSNKITLQRVKNAMHGDGDTQYGFSLSFNFDGTRLAVADISSVRIYEQLGDEDWIKLGNTIQSPENTTQVTGLLEVGTVLIRAPVIAKMSSDGSSVAVGWSTYAENIGMVQVFRLNIISKEWVPHGEALVGSSPGEYFGASLDLSEDGSVVAVGSPGNGGMVGIYTFNIGEWVDFGNPLSVADVGGMTITSVALARNGRTLAFGGTANRQETVARMYRFNVATGDWKELGTGLLSGQDGTAYVVDLSGDGTTVAISNYYYLESNPGENNDALDVRAYFWSENQNRWIQLGETLHAFSPGAKSGYFISLSDDGRTLTMGDPGRIGEAGFGGNTGHAHVYIFSDDLWHQLGPNILGEAPGDHFGYDVTVSGDGTRFASSAPFSRALGTPTPHGRVLVFEIPQDTK